jgi:exopolyphosphatase/guanosine-5'-triphosphate,3'-diphosphate pyrophosphatase
LDSAPERDAADPKVYAAVDLGSNSFHLIVAQLTHGQLTVLDRLRETVRLGAGLDEQKFLVHDAQERALDCLHRFGQRIGSLAPDVVRVVGTNTLRVAKNSADFVVAARAALGHPVEIIGGREEARLIYLGVANALEGGDERRLVVDIGGGSTEIITGKGFNSIHRESLHVGCVSLAGSYLPSGKLKKKKIKAAELTAELAIRPVASMFRRTGWDRAIGCSGTVKVIRTVVLEQGWCDSGISLESLRNLRQVLSEFDDVDQLKELGVAPERRPIFVSGMAVLWAVFDQLGIEHMDVSDEALREGVLYDLIGRTKYTDVREKTVNSLLRRWAVDEQHARQVYGTAEKYHALTARDWGLDEPDLKSMLRWGALLHEIGLLISHGQYHKHGAYVVGNADMSGFSRQDQAVLAALVRGHRRTFPAEVFHDLNNASEEAVLRLCVLLRLAILMHRDRSVSPIPEVDFNPKDHNLHLRFPAGWLEKHPLTLIDLEQEACYLKAASINLTFSSRA